MEKSKTAKWRFADGAFHLWYSAGHGLDVSGKPDPLGSKSDVRPIALLPHPELEGENAQFLAGIPDASLDFVHSSHSLEYLRDPREGLAKWCGW